MLDNSAQPAATILAYTPASQLASFDGITAASIPAMSMFTSTNIAETLTQLKRFDEALALPTEEAVRVALRTQQIIAHETGVANTIDPLGGSYFVEALTDEMLAATAPWLPQFA